MSEKRKYKRSKEEIAREFELPVRKSKIATIEKQNEAYCICRSSDCSRFMIGCDGCEEWYHGDCINITEKESRHIKKYYCFRCKEEDPSLQTVFRVSSAERAAQQQQQQQQLSNVKETVHHSTSKHREKVVERRESSHSHHKSNFTSVIETINSPVTAIRCNCGICESCRLVQQQRLYQEEQKKAEAAAAVKILKKREKHPKSRQRKRKRSLTPEPFINPDLEGIRQCYGPGCRMNSRPQSKYCCDDCGLRLATNRIFQVLPQRINEWKITPCRAEEENKKHLDQIRAKQAVVSFALAELDKRHAELDMVVQRAKSMTLDRNRVPEPTENYDEEHMYCITCGHEIHSRTAIKHMTKCFNKYESQSSFGSVFKTKIEGKALFCDFYNTVSKTYCKRLRVLCPEHSKDPKVSENDVCGCPLVTKVFNPTGEFCRAPKKSCFKHYTWEKIRRAEIDLERVRQWLKMDELLDQERQIRAMMASRAGVLGLMLHSTYNHELMEEIRRHQAQYAAAVLQKDCDKKKKYL